MTRTPEALRANLTNAEFAQLVAESATLRAQRDELARALALFTQAHDANYVSAMAEDSERSAYDDAFDAARAAIAKVKP